MRIVFVERPDPTNVNLQNRFAVAAAILRASDHEVTVIDGVLSDTGSRPPVLTALNRAVSGAPMIDANNLAHHLAPVRPDIVIAPLRGGIAQGVLMARACGEEFGDTRIALWCDTPTRTKFLRDDGLADGIAPFVCDALERQACMLADALIGPGDLRPDVLAILGDRSPPLFQTTLRPPTKLAKSAPPEMIKEIVFAGPMTRQAGLMEFVEAVESLSRTGEIAGRTVTFLGPAAPTSQGIGREWLGLRAAHWPFPFKVLDLPSHEERVRYFDHANRLAVGIADDPDELLLLDARHVAILRGSDDPPTLLRRIKDALVSALTSTHSESMPPNHTGIMLDWSTLVSQIAEWPSSTPALPATLDAGVTVAVLHYNRLQQLSEAIASIPDEMDGHPVELIVLDNASTIPAVIDEIERITSSRRSTRIIGFSESIPQATAYNHALRIAQFETVLFLDDDNRFASGGIRRLANALSIGKLDVAVAALDVFDNAPPASTSSAGRLIFLGAAHSAGLFFNAFGDTAMAVRRESFLRLGGFHDIGYTYPSLDWVTLAKAQARGLRIGALQWPAVHYRRDTLRADTSAKKLDFEGARSLVFEAYDNSFDAALLGRYAQKLQFEEL